jgi:hypothetical protein
MRACQLKGERVPERELPWPLRYLVDADGHDTGFAMLRGPIRPDEHDAFDEMLANHRMIGFTHHGWFPLLHPAYQPMTADTDPRSGLERAEVRSCEAWCHCFRRPEEYLPPGKPSWLVSGSDWVDAGEVTGWAYQDGGKPAKQWDVIYCCINNWHHEVRKNWSLAKVCVEVLVRELGFSALLIGRAGIPDVPRSSNVDVRTNLSWPQLLAHTAASRMALLPNVFDPSPRVLAEAIALDVPVLVNADILGGWKYLNDATGRTFSDETELVDGAMACLTDALSPQAWWLERYGQDVSSRRLAGHLRTLGGVDDLEYAFPTDWLRK